ncbi:MAG: hypothetical protein BGP14_23905 [Sphingobacteriales bacterium 44-15]|nr:MAG: hypothetical protein BGP14_23905 [Sphingobacteriales bacterium 44-15]
MKEYDTTQQDPALAKEMHLAKDSINRAAPHLRSYIPFVKGARKIKNSFAVMPYCTAIFLWIIREVFYYFTTFKQFVKKSDKQILIGL